MRVCKKFILLIWTLIILLSSQSIVFADKVQDVTNVAPVVDFSVVKKKKVDVEILTDYTGAKYNDLVSRLNALKANVYPNNVDLQFNVVAGDNTISVGNMLRRKLYYRGEDQTKYLIDYANNYQRSTNVTGVYRHYYSVRQYDTPITYDGLNNVIQIAGYGIPYYIDENGNPQSPYETSWMENGQVVYGYYGYKSWVALDAFGYVWTKGENQNGQLGDGTTTNSNVWRKVSGLNNIVQITQTGNGVAALKSDNTVYLWGEDTYYAVTDRSLFNIYKSYKYLTPQVVNTANLWGYTDLSVIGSDNYWGGFECIAANNVPVFNFRYIKSENYWDGQYTQIRYTLENWGYLIWLGNDLLTKVDTQTPISSVNSTAITNAPLREGSDRYFIYVSDGQGENYGSGFGNYYGFSNLNKSFYKYLNDNNFYGYAVTPSTNYDYVNGLGKQELTIRNLINGLNSGGSILNGGQIQVALDSIQTKCINAANQPVSSYVLINEEDMNYTTYFTDSENDPKYTDQWVYVHTPTAFDNNLGTASFSGAALSSPVTNFSLPGKYDVTLYSKDNPKNISSFDAYKKWSNPKQMTIYAHRRPIADFSVGVTGTDGYGNYITTVSDNAYDLDHTSLSNKGIVQTEWLWKPVSGSSWNSGLPTTLSPGTDYVITERVKDVEGVWSYPCTKLLQTVPSALPPTVDCTPTSKNWTNQNVTATVTATDPSGDFAYTNYKWTTSTLKPSSGWSQSGAATFATTQTAEGIWYLHMEAFDAAGNKFYRYRGPYKIDKTPPVIGSATVDGTTINANSYKVYGNNITDALSGVKEVRFPTWTTYNGQDDLIQPWSSYYLGTNYSGNNWYYTVNSSGEDGQYNTHVYAWDNAGNYSAVVAPNVNVQKNSPPTVNITNRIPSYVYESDSVKIQYKPNDSDLNTLTAYMTLTKNGTTVWSKTKTITPSGGTYSTEEETPIANAEAGANYKFTVTVTDPSNTSASDSMTFTAYDLGITGSVTHTTLWEQHRQDYNTSKGGSYNSPRKTNDFFPGEKFIINANTTLINSSRPDLTATSVKCKMNLSGIGEVYMTKTSSNTWTGFIWDESMVNLSSINNISCTFTVTYSNGSIKQYVCYVNIVDDDYWLIHRKF